MSALMPVYRALPIAMERGQGVWLWDTQGKKYLDVLAGIAVCNLGHCHPHVVQAIQQQAAKLIHTSNVVTIALEEVLATRLSEFAHMEQAFFANSGAEANECALKIARMYGHKREIETPLIVVMEKSFHGRTLATLTATGNRKVQAGFEPLMPGFLRVPFNDIDAIVTLAETNPNIVAVLVEPIQGEGGIIVPASDYLQKLRHICDQHQWLLMLDEVQTGMGRTGKYFAHQYAGILPDVMTLAKALGNGFPIGACLARGPAKNCLQQNNHGSTFGGNPLACATALAVLDVFESEPILENVNRVGSYLLQGLRSALASHPRVLEVRGQGLFIGIAMDAPCRELLAVGADLGLLFSVTGETVIRLTPPLILTIEEADQVIDLINKTLGKWRQPSHGAIARNKQS